MIFLYFFGTLESDLNFMEILKQAWMTYPYFNKKFCFLSLEWVESKVWLHKRTAFEDAGHVIFKGGEIELYVVNFLREEI